MSSLQQFDFCEELSDAQSATICGGTVGVTTPIGSLDAYVGPSGGSVVTEGILGKREVGLGSGGVTTSGNTAVTSIASGLGVDTLNSLKVGG